MRIIDIVRPDFVISNYELGVPLMIEGSPGIGKSQIPKIMRRILSQHFQCEMGLHTEHATTLDAPDVRGFLVPTKDSEGHPSSFFTRPAIMPSREYLREHPRGIYFIDERPQAQLLTQTALAPVVLEKKFGEHELPAGWWVISAGNRMQDKSGVVRPPMHLINRETTIHLQFDIFSASVHWEAIGMHPMGVAFAKTKPGVFADAVPKDPKPYCTPRSFEATLRRLAMLAGTDNKGNPNMNLPSDPVVQELTAGDVGEGTAAEMFAYFKVADQLPTIEQVKNDPQGCKAPSRLDAAYAAVQMCIHHANADNINKLWTFVERLPKELQTSACKSFIEKSGGALMNSDALGKWISENRALVISSTRN